MESISMNTLKAIYGHFELMDPPIIKIYCPLCKSEDISSRQILIATSIVVGYPRLKFIHVCNKCGIMFKPTKGNGL